MAWRGPRFTNQSSNAGPMVPGIPVYTESRYPTESNPFEMEIHTMSSVLWCDKGEHAFSAKDTERQHFTKTQQVQIPTGNSYGGTTYQQRQEITEELDICGPCWTKGNDFEPKQLANGQETLEDMEESNAEWQAGYDAAMNRLARRMTPGAE
jgi:hypothetical protein